MDPVLEIDGFGNGRVTLYRYGKTWRMDVRSWEVQPLQYQPPDNPMEREARLEVARLHDAKRGLGH